MYMRSYWLRCLKLKKKKTLQTHYHSFQIGNYGKQVRVYHSTSPLQCLPLIITSRRRNLYCCICHVPLIARSWIQKPVLFLLKSLVNMAVRNDVEDIKFQFCSEEPVLWPVKFLTDPVKLLNSSMPFSWKMKRKSSPYSRMNELNSTEMTFSAGTWNFQR